MSKSILGLYVDPNNAADAMDGLKDSGFERGTFDVLTGTPNINLEDKALQYFTANASANWTWNFRGGPSETLNDLMAANDVMTVTLLTTHGGTAYIPSGTNADCRVKVDGTDVTVKWSGGSAPTAGNDNGIDSYTYSIIKTGNAAFTVIGSATAYG